MIINNTHCDYWVNVWIFHLKIKLKLKMCLFDSVFHEQTTEKDLSWGFGTVHVWLNGVLSSGDLCKVYFWLSPCLIDSVTHPWFWLGMNGTWQLIIHTENWWFDEYILLKNYKRKLVSSRVLHDCRPDGYLDKNIGSNWNCTGKFKNK